MTFDLAEVLDFGLQGFNLNTVETTSRHTKLIMHLKQPVERILCFRFNRMDNVAVPHAQCEVCGLSMLEETCRDLHHILLCHS